ncbi:hypothetical protein LO762_09470 [Actinocorallia sp. API 0066]|uniref:hypothetical protein n=1 Tax=Actinocorallia sp. API 0066 TaxID=2896846 RepID=UPI001E2A19DE|nr:hypothetical protein [Actinocorallia sp. API 0066]MCD0449416.1 hypothetical protein [Actinocorallia sp. API 0066]
MISTRTLACAALVAVVLVAAVALGLAADASWPDALLAALTLTVPVIGLLILPSQRGDDD